MGRFATAAKVAREKETHPERFCPVRGCLWRTSHAHGPDTPCLKHPEQQRPRLMWSARCDCYKGHNSASGRCNVRDVTALVRTEGAPVLCERCLTQCKGA